MIDGLLSATGSDIYILNNTIKVNLADVGSAADVDDDAAGDDVGILVVAQRLAAELKVRAETRPNRIGPA